MSHAAVESETMAVVREERDVHAAYALERIRDALRALRFGTVTVVVQDGVVVQVERTEKLRIVRRE